MCSSRVEVEFGRIGRIVALERYFLVLTSNIECLLGTKRVLHAIDDDDTGTLATVDHAKLAVVEEVVLLQEDIANLLCHLQLEFLRYGHGATEDEAVVHRVGEVDLVSHHDLLHYEALAQRLRVVVLHVVRMAGNLLGHVDLCIGAHGKHCQCAQKNHFLHNYYLFGFWSWFYIPGYRYLGISGYRYIGIS